MKRAAIPFAVLVSVACVCGGAFGAGDTVAGKAPVFDTDTGVPPVQPVAVTADDLRALGDKVDALNQANAANFITTANVIVTAVIGVFGVLITVFLFISGYLVYRSRKLNEDAERMLDEVRLLSRSAKDELSQTHDNLSAALLVINGSVQESKGLIDNLKADSAKRIEELKTQGEAYLTKMREDAMAELNIIREAAQTSAEEAKVSEVKTEKLKSAFEYFQEAYRAARRGEHQRAVDNYEKGLELDPNNAAAYGAMGFSLVDLDRHVDAIVAYDKAIEIDPKNTIAYSNKCYSLIWLKDYDKAIESIDIAISLGMRLRQNRINKALALQRRDGEGDAEQAAEILEGLLKENDRDADAARAYSMLGKKDEMLALVKDLVAKNATLKNNFKRELEFEPYRTDPDFIAIVGE